MPGQFDLQFSPTAHLRLLLRLDRGLNVQRAVAEAVKPGDRVFDAGTGTGLLSFLACRAGATEVIAVDRQHIAIAQRLADDNRFIGNITFISAELDDISKLEIQGKFDVLFAFIYANHIILDADRSRLIFLLRARLGNESCKVVPNRVAYTAYACEWVGRDLPTECEDLKQAVRRLESCYRLNFTSLYSDVLEEMTLFDSRVNSRGRYAWQPSSPIASARFDRAELRLLSEGVPFTEIRYEEMQSFPGYPETIALPISIKDGRTHAGLGSDYRNDINH